MKTAEKVLKLLETRAFERWYEEEFVPYIEGGEDAPCRGEILDFLSVRLDEGIRNTQEWS